MNNSRAQGDHRVRLQQIARRVMTERGLLTDFSDEIVAELKTAPDRAAADSDQRRDLRQLLWSSIDNDDSRDLDQLTAAEAQDNGAIRIGIAVADVDVIVHKNEAIDGHARHNTTSVYTGAQIFPMLPNRLSTDLTSLNEHEDRAAMVVMMTVDEDGLVSNPDICLATVHNYAQLAYDSVAAWLDGIGPMPEPIGRVEGLEENLRLQDQAAQRLKCRRFDHGALDLQTLRPRPVFDADQVSDLSVDEKNCAKELIEDFMIAANGVTARYLEEQNRASLRRLVRVPRRWEKIVDLAAELGCPLPMTPDPKALSDFLDTQHREDPVSFPDLSLTVVKLLGRGEYTVKVPGEEAPGHFGLAVRDYAHSTAPNRRFPDLITQRLIKSALRGEKAAYTASELRDLADRCTRKEDDANKVERLVAKSAAAMVLEARIGERFEGIVSGAAAKGTWVRIFDPPVEGKLVRGEEGVDVGDHVRVELMKTDIERGHIDFKLVQER